jgi:hypothetical protein
MVIFSRIRFTEFVVIRINKMKMALIISMTILVLPLGYLVKDYSHEFLEVNACLDLAGSYDYVQHKCDQYENHPYTSYTGRKKTLIMSCLTLSLGGLLSSIMIKRKI